VGRRAVEKLGEQVRRCEIAPDDPSHRIGLLFHALPLAVDTSHAEKRQMSPGIGDRFRHRPLVEAFEDILGDIVIRIADKMCRQEGDDGDRSTLVQQEPHLLPFKEMPSQGGIRV
jgi:hypothetical protein